MPAMVVQFGLATMPLGIDCKASTLTSGATTSGTSGCMRQAEELSTTMAPAAATTGAYSFDAGAPLENSASCRPEKSAVAVSSTTISSSPHANVVPAERADAK